MSDEASVRVWGFVLQLANGVLEALQVRGERGAFWQVFDPDPDGPIEPEIGETRYTREGARRYIGERIQGGFQGLAGFSCVEEDSEGIHMRFEGFDSVEGTSLTARLQLKKTFLGKLKPTADALELDDLPPGIPGVFAPRERSEE